ncbi:hypothetical protein CL689_06175 [Candidatus Saccharibacteria bacterium]|nr:hypothetical protein [Candidatus Saccharibacteria bacterium]|tara:strand:- start:5279 stop:5569 length:291 start_codon:yes stop_codon:yes gene_type:complete
MYIASIISSDNGVEISYDPTKEGAVRKARQKLSTKMGVNLEEVEGFFLFDDEALAVDLMQTDLSEEEIEGRCALISGATGTDQIIRMFEAELCCQV